MSTSQASSALANRLQQGPLLCDGAMGSQLYAHGISFEQGFEYQNVVAPQLVERIHRSYLSAGAGLIETNTFGANAVKLASHGLAEQVHAINRAGARVARNAREVSGIDALIAGSIGPLGRLLEPFGEISQTQARSYFCQAIEGLIEGGIDLLMLETFSDLDEISAAVRAAREVCDLPIVAQMTFTEELLTPAGQTPEDVACALDQLGVEVIGTNCSVGPQGILHVVERMVQVTGKPLSAQPNAGLPQKIGGRLLYLSSPAYLADYAVRLAAAGARLIGGCCGTTPAHIAAMAASLPETAGPVKPANGAPAIMPSAPVEQGQDIAEPVSALEIALRSGTGISVELAPPRGANPAKLLAGARTLKDAGVDVVNVTDGAMARVRMSTLAAGSLIRQYVGLEPILHVTTRDRNLMALQSDLIGAYAMGVRGILALTGDPPHTGDYALAKSVYDIDSIGLIRMLRQLNEGVDVAGNATGRRTSFLIGAALNPTAQDLDLELDRFARKLEAGADFVMTQPVYDAELFTRVLARIGPVKVPILMGVMPLQSYRNAEFVHNELPGVTLTESILARMRAAGADGQAEGLAISLEVLEACVDLVQGVYIMPTFQRYDPAADLVRHLRSHLLSPARRHQAANS